MRDGKVIGNVVTAETNAAELARMMVGRDVLLRLTKDAAKPTAVVLSIKALSVMGEDRVPRLSGLNLEVRAGEVVGIAGVEGNGQTELIESLAGLIPSVQQKGTVTLNGADITQASARRRKELGVAHIPEDRHRRGLLLEAPLTENAILGVHYRPPAVSTLGVFLDDAAIKRRTDQIITDFDVRPPNSALPARALSGGNQQKLIIGREFGLPPKLLLVSQPTRGVDIGAIEFIHRKLIELRDSGAAILLVSAELEEVTSLSDRLLVIHDGKIVGEVDPAVATHEEIGLMMTGGGHRDNSTSGGPPPSEKFGDAFGKPGGTKLNS
jgi:simple sugar transport system ATP-binding protein